LKTKLKKMFSKLNLIYFLFSKISCLRRWSDCSPRRISRKRSDHTARTVGVCKRLAFQCLSFALQTANARMVRPRKALVSRLSVIPQLLGSASWCRDELRRTVQRFVYSVYKYPKKNLACLDWSAAEKPGGSAAFAGGEAK
jgi:hypothetical protein